MIKLLTTDDWWFSNWKYHEFCLSKQYSSSSQFHDYQIVAQPRYILYFVSATSLKMYKETEKERERAFT